MLEGVKVDHFIDWLDVEIFMLVFVLRASVGVGDHAEELILAPLYN